MHRTFLASMLLRPAEGEPPSPDAANSVFAMRRLSVLALVAAFVASGCGGGGGPSQTERDRAVTEAMAAYHEAKVTDINLERGPCIAEQLPGMPDWVVDVAHDPRQPVDDDPANQCARFRAGEAHHFVELDPQGNLIRAE
jgi:hypothetical protein